MAERVRITDVSPRDGLQNEPGVIATADKVRLVGVLCRANVDEVEITSFVNPKWVPQLADAADVVVGVRDMLVQQPHSGGPSSFSVLIPNLKGLHDLEDAERRGPRHDMGNFVPPLVNKISLFTAASETFSQRNTNASIAQTIDRFREVMREPRSATETRGYISCAIACPFEGPIKPAAVADVAARLVDLGVSEIDLGDTIGAGTPGSVAAVLEAVQKRIGSGWFERSALTLHLHDTFGRAAECVLEALRLGVRSFDGSVAGLGGCPYASSPGKRAPGNINTELLVKTVEAAGFETGVNLEKLRDAGAFASKIVAAARAAGG